jgi:hypothetical protein
LHGPHHGAQKSTRRGVAEAATAVLNVSVVRCVILSDIGFGRNLEAGPRNCKSSG